jgi:eukaryotic-like serine/threonine-protein kinase
MHTPLAFPPPPSSGSPTPPMVLSSRLRVLERLGAGRRTDVLLAIASGPMGFERPVVIKRPAPGLSGHELEAVRRELLREATAYSRAGHPALVRLYDFVEDNLLPTLVLEHIDGLSLARIVTKLRARGEMLDDASSMFVAYRLFVGLGALHGARDPLTREFAAVIHRDVCPANVLVPWDGFARLGDLGDARIGGTMPDTRPGERHGTMGYLAPEQVRGESATVRTDVYSACIVLRELLLRAPAFSREGRTEVELLRAMADADLTPIERLRSDLPRELVWALGVGLARDPERRTIGAEEMSDILRRAIDVEGARRGLVERLVPLRTRATRLHGSPTVPDVDSATELDDSDLGCDDPDETPITLMTGPRDSKYARLRDSQSADTSRPPPLAESAVVPIAPVALAAPRVAPVTSLMRPGAPPPSPRLVVPTPPQMRPQWSSAPPALVYEPPTPSQEMRRPMSTPRILSFAAVASVLAGAAIGGVFALHENRVTTRDAAPTAPAPTAPAPPSLAAPPPAPAPTAPAPTAPARPSLAAPALAPTTPPAPAPVVAPGPVTPAPVALKPGTGRVITDAAERGHRVWVDGRLVGAGGAPLVVSCGWRRVRVGSHGRLKQVAVPCGGDVLVRR